MPINTSKLSIAVAFTTLMAWILCSLAVAVLPDLTMTITGHLFHMPTGALDWSLTWSSFAMGAICWTGFAFLFTWVAAATYNSLRPGA